MVLTLVKLGTKSDFSCNRSNWSKYRSCKRSIRKERYDMKCIYYYSGSMFAAHGIEKNQMSLSKVMTEKGVEVIYNGCDRGIERINSVRNRA